MKPFTPHPAGFDSLILSIRGQKVLLDADLAAIYDVPTKALNQAVKRNADRFPEEFLFPLTQSEKEQVVTICDHLSRLKFSKTCPNAFTEHGALMTANVLSSPEAVKMTRHQLLATRHGPKPLSTFRLHTSSFFNAPLPPKKEIGFHVRNESSLSGPRSKSTKASK
ncbi:MAG: ORF6N domain-containing protein [Spartobacteria bacterium]